MPKVVYFAVVLFQASVWSSVPGLSKALRSALTLLPLLMLVVSTLFWPCLAFGWSVIWLSVPLLSKALRSALTLVVPLLMLVVSGVVGQNATGQRLAVGPAVVEGAQVGAHAVAVADAGGEGVVFKSGGERLAVGAAVIQGREVEGHGIAVADLQSQLVVVVQRGHHQGLVGGGQVKLGRAAVGLGVGNAVLCKHGIAAQNVAAHDGPFFGGRIENEQFSGCGVVEQGARAGGFGQFLAVVLAEVGTWLLALCHWRVTRRLTGSVIS